MEKMKLYNGIKIPCIGYGTCEVNNTEIIEEALLKGYRLLDTAAHYFNEGVVGDAIIASPLEREKIFVTTKLWYSDMGYDNTICAFENSLKKLQLTYLDLYLVHWPAESKKYPNWQETNRETWKALEDLYLDKKIRAIGVCNFMEKHMRELLNCCRIKPMINQVENHPGFYQKNIADFCQKEGIQMEAWGPLGTGEILNNKNIVDIAEKMGKTPAQICLRWNLQHNFIVIPKSSDSKRMIENMNIFDFTISEEDMYMIDNLPFCGGQGAIVK